jgi:hypothetical protein
MWPCFVLVQTRWPQTEQKSSTIQMNLSNIFWTICMVTSSQLRDLVKEWFHLLILVDKFHAFETKTFTTSFFKSSKSVPPDISKVVLHDRTANIVGWQFLRKGSTSPYLTSPKSRLGRQVAQPVHRSLSSSPTPSPAPKRGPGKTQQKVDQILDDLSDEFFFTMRYSEEHTNLRSIT